MSEKICIFAGTTEGRKLAEMLKDRADLTVCVATEYGEVMLEGIEGITVHTGRMDESEMEKLFTQEGFSRIIDATHPYADIVTENIVSAAEQSGTSVIRILRGGETHIENAVYVSSAAEASDFLAKHDGNVLITTGAKELAVYSGLDTSRVWARVLPTAASIESCVNAGIPTSHIIAAQGPFSREMNIAQLRMIGADYMVTKASGRNGGFDEKIEAAAEAGATPIIIGQPPQVKGMTLDEAVAELDSELSLPRRKVYVVGIGPGSHELLTSEARVAIENCDAVLGAASVAEVTGTRKPVFKEFLPSGIRKALEENPSVRCAAVVMRGDTGFYSGAKKLAAELSDYDVTVIPGISSVSLLAARLNVSWDDAALISMHGRDQNIAVLTGRTGKMFVLCGGDNTPNAVCRHLTKYGYGDLDTAVGEKLSYPEEKVTKGKVSELADMQFDALSVLYIENPNAKERVRTGIPDTEFVRSDVPMTKSEIRAVSMSKLDLDSRSVVWDVGSGTGSVSVECALAAYNGKVYAIEKEEDAAELTEKNAVFFGADNIKVIRGTAPQALSDLPAPTHVFIGGSGGGLIETVAECLKKNPDVRIVVNTITLETQTEVVECAKKFGFKYFEAVSVSAARSRKAGKYNMMLAQNPVYVFTMQGGTIDD